MAAAKLPSRRVHIPKTTYRSSGHRAYPSRPQDWHSKVFLFEWRPCPSLVLWTRSSLLACRNHLQWWKCWRTSNLCAISFDHVAILILLPCALGPSKSILPCTWSCFSGEFDSVSEYRLQRQIPWQHTKRMSCRHKTPICILWYITRCKKPGYVFRWERYLSLFISWHRSSPA